MSPVGGRTRHDKNIVSFVLPKRARIPVQVNISELCPLLFGDRRKKTVSVRCPVEGAQLGTTLDVDLLNGWSLQEQQPNSPLKLPDERDPLALG